MICSDELFEVEQDLAKERERKKEFNLRAMLFMQPCRCTYMGSDNWYQVFRRRLPRCLWSALHTI